MLSGLPRGEPGAGDRVQPEAVGLADGPADGAEVDPVDFRGVAVGQARDTRPARVGDDGVEAAGPVAVVLEAVGGDDPEAGAAAFFFVGGDPLQRPGEDGVQGEQA